MTYRIFKNRLKKAWLSITIWFNGFVAPGLWALQEYAGLWADDKDMLIGFIIFVNGVIRFITTKDLADK